MTYVEIVIQLRDTHNNAIRTHYHFTLQPQLPQLFATNRAAEVTSYLKAGTIPYHISDDAKPCSVCYTLDNEAPHDPGTSRQPKTR